MQQKKDLPVEQLNDNGNNQGENIACNVEQILLSGRVRQPRGGDKSGKIEEVYKQCDPCLYEECLIRIESETVEDVVYGDVLSADDFQVKIGAAGRKQSGQNRDSERNRNVYTHSDNGGSIFRKGQRGEREKHRADRHKQPCADGSSVMSEHMLFSGGLKLRGRS